MSFRRQRHRRKSSTSDLTICCKYFRQSAFVWLLLLVLTPPLCAQRGAITAPRNLAELVAQSDTIVRGRVVLALLEPHPQLKHLSTVVVTLQVEETLKGNPAKTLTYRQFIWDVRDRYDAAGYRKGQRLLLLLNPTTPYGLRSPAGLEQGRFRLQRNAGGRQFALNGAANAGLFREVAGRLEARGLSTEAALSRRLAERRPGPVEVEGLLALIRALVRIR